jgi:Holliday junction DNA helicase RuvA
LTSKQIYDKIEIKGKNKLYRYISGKLEELGESAAVIDVGGIGYLLNITAVCRKRLEELSDEHKQSVKLYTYLVVREDALELCGFYSPEELAAFKLLITVSGVGPKAALSLLSAMPPEKFASAVIYGNTKALSAAPGIGPKTAARITLELKDKVSKQLSPSDPDESSETPSAPPDAKRRDVENALSVLGYSRYEIASAIKGIDIDTTELEDIIKLALNKFAKKN